MKEDALYRIIETLGFVRRWLCIIVSHLLKEKRFQGLIYMYMYNVGIGLIVIDFIFNKSIVEVEMSIKIKDSFSGNL